jgi:hypothetical protein
MRSPPLNWGKTKERLEAALLDPLGGLAFAEAVSAFLRKRRVSK